MLSIISMNRAGLSDGCLSVKVDFEFDNASTLPERVITVSGMSYIIAKDSTAKNTVTNVNYKYNGSKWVKVTETVEPVTGGTITDNGDYTITSNEYTGLSDISVDVPTEDSYVYLVYGTFTNNWPNPSTISTFVGDVGVLKVDDGNAVVDCFPRDPSGHEIIMSYILLNGTVNTINVTQHGYPVTLSFKAGANISEFTVLGTTVVPTGAEITAGNWYIALIQRVNGVETVTVEMNNNLGRTVVTPKQ